VKKALLTISLICLFFPTNCSRFESEDMDSDEIHYFDRTYNETSEGPKRNLFNEYITKEPGNKNKFSLKKSKKSQDLESLEKEEIKKN